MNHERICGEHMRQRDEEAQRPEEVMNVSGLKKPNMARVRRDWAEAMSHNQSVHHFWS